MSNTRIYVVGLGGIGCDLAVSLGRKGVGYLFLQDGDGVAASNLNRTPYRWQDVGALKAHASAELVTAAATSATAIVAIPWHFPSRNTPAEVETADIVFAAVDNDEARRERSQPGPIDEGSP